MRVIDLKLATFGVFYKPGGPIAGKVPKGQPFDPETMVARTFSYRASIEEVLSNPPDPRAGVKIVEVRKAMKILDVLETVDDGQALVLEDDQWSYLDSRVQDTNWMVVNPAVIQFCDDIHGAKAISAERLAAAAKDPTPIRKKGKEEAS